MSQKLALITITIELKNKPKLSSGQLGSMMKSLD